MIDTIFPALSINLNGKPAFGFSDHTRNNNLFKVGDNLSRRARPRRERTEDFFEQNIWVPHIYQVLDYRTLSTVGAPSIMAR